ncbi:MAG: hypothetical protein ACE5HT_01300 [Gemmatimonadales bacterium]
MLGSRLHAVFRGYADVRAGSEDVALERAKAYGFSTDSARAFWRGLRNKTLPVDRDLADSTLAYDGDETHRVVAAGILMNFADTDATWWSLVEALRDPDDGVKEVARFALLGFLDTGREIHHVDWQPVQSPLRHLLAGTNPSSFRDLLDILRSTTIEPQLARGLLGESNDFLQGFLDADYAPIRDGVVKFLTYVYQDDHGDVHYWKDKLRHMK